MGWQVPLASKVVGAPSSGASRSGRVRSLTPSLDGRPGPRAPSPRCPFGCEVGPRVSSIGTSCGSGASSIRSPSSVVAASHSSTPSARELFVEPWRGVVSCVPPPAVKPSRRVMSSPCTPFVEVFCGGASTARLPVAIRCRGDVCGPRSIGASRDGVSSPCSRLSTAVASRSSVSIAGRSSAGLTRLLPLLRPAPCRAHARPRLLPKALTPRVSQSRLL